MNIPITILTHQVTSRRLSGGGNSPNNNNGFDPDLFFMGAVACIPFLIGLVIIINMITTVRLPEYEVDGTVVRYIGKTSGKTKKIFVDLQQIDGKVRQYNTNIQPRECKMAVIGTHIPVIVTPLYSRWLETWHYESRLKYNPCLK